MYKVYNFITVQEGEADEVLIFVSDTEVYMEGAAGDIRVQPSTITPETAQVLESVLGAVGYVSITEAESLP